MRIRCEKLDQIAELLDIITSQKNATIEQITWKYPDEEVRARALAAAIATAKSKADKIAASLGVKLLGVYQYNDNTFDEEAPFPQYQSLGMMPQAARKSAAPEPSLGMEIQHSKTVQVNVEIEYRVSGF